MRQLPPLALLLLACAHPPPRRDVPEDCPTAVAAEKELAAREGRPPKPVIQRGVLLTNVLDDRNRPAVTFAMAVEARTASLKVLARISVRADGSVESVEVVNGSGSKSFDQAVAAKMMTWTHRPSLLNCRPVPYSYPMRFEHRYAR